jgi:hypothetical protein
MEPKLKATRLLQKLEDKLRRFRCSLGAWGDHQPVPITSEPTGRMEP